MSYASHFQRFRAANAGNVHLAAHSHHWWPDVTREAQLEAWDDAARGTDHKWDKFFSEVYPAAQRHAAGYFTGVAPDRVCFATNTHELLVRLITSLWKPGKSLSVLTTDSEFHSATRQFQRWSEDGWIKLKTVATDPWGNFEDEFMTALETQKPDVVFLSQVFFNSGLCCSGDFLKDVAAYCNSHQAEFIVDGYHGFAAFPFPAPEILHTAFYLAGGYKYAAAGEGSCFVIAPPGRVPRPMLTGWFASYGALTSSSAEVGFSPDAGRFLGATFDPTSLYRWNAVHELWRKIGSTVEQRHAVVKDLKKKFLRQLSASRTPALDPGLLISQETTEAHFVTLRTPVAVALAEAFAEQRVIVDARGDRLRFGFGIYQTDEDLTEFWKRLPKVLPVL